ncbi:MAG: hypothetical protein AAGF44_09130 [Pseudomonadota bacterium]
MFISLPLAFGACLLKKKALCHTMLKVSALSGTAWTAAGLYMSAQKRWKLEVGRAVPPDTATNDLINDGSSR